MTKIDDESKVVNLDSGFDSRNWLLLYRLSCMGYPPG